MTSPYPLTITTQIYYDGGWHTISVDARQSQDITMKWGRADEANVAAPNELGLLLNNGQSRVNPAVSGRYSLHNPRSDLFGKISRNTPIRVRLGASDTAMVLGGLEDSYASTPDVAALDVTGDIDIRFDADIDWVPGPNADQTIGIGIARKYETGGDQRSWALYTSSTDRLSFVWSPDGTLASRITANASVPMPISSGRLAVRVTLDVNNGAGGHTVTFYTGPSMAGPWTQLGAQTVTAGTTSIFSSTRPVEVGRVHGATAGGIGANPLNGRVYGFQMRSGIGGTVVADLDLTAQDPGTEVVLVDSAGRTWTLHSLAHVDDLSVRMVGEITNMPTEWDITGRDVWVPLRAKSITRRLGQGRSPLRSALYRDLSTASGIVAYWPLEDGRDATSAAEALTGTRPLILTGDVTMAAYSEFAGSDAVPTFGTASHLSGPVPSYVPHARQRVACMLHQAENMATDRNLIFVACSGGTVADVTLVLKADGSLRIVFRDTAETHLLDFSGGVGDLRGEHAMVWMLLTQNGANIDWQFGKIAEGETAGTIQSGTLAGRTYGRFTTMILGSAGDLAGTSVGHVHIINGNDDAGFWNTVATSLIAWDGESAGDRIIRLCAEQRVPLTFIGDPGRTPRMGKQGIKTLLDLLQECADADLGILDDHTRLLAKRYRTRKSLYNQDPTLTLDYTAGECAPPLRPVPDDQATRNDVTVTRSGGSSARSVQETGPLNVQDPTEDPQGVGRYDEDKTLFLASDFQLKDQAGWRRHLGTVNEDRYPSIRVNLGRDPHLTDSMRVLGPGGLLRITNPPAWLPGGNIDQMVQGGTETLNTYKHEVDLTCTPASPWRVARTSDSTMVQKVNTGGSQVAASFDAGTDTSLSVTVTGDKLWTTDAAHYPLEIYVDGVVLEVTAASGASSPQTLNVTATPVNGVEKTIAAGKPIRLAPPPITAL